jgi:peptidoglycan/xylan/chitin deacetylase (PgdA/CDA1 family)
MARDFPAPSSFHGAVLGAVVAVYTALGAALPVEARAGTAAQGSAGGKPVEIHQRLVTREGERAVALTLDACGGGFDAELIETLVEFRVPATAFVTRRWIERHPEGMAMLAAHPDLFAIEDHGARHLPAVLGEQKRVFGLRGVPDIARLRDEVAGGARAIAAAGAPEPRWYRGATARYDPEAVSEIQSMGYRIAGFSVNADAGATLTRRAVAARLARVQPGDIVLAHMNKPQSESAEGLRDALPGLLARGIRFVTLRGREVETLPAPTSRN